MIYTPLTNKALTIAYTAHQNQVDKAGIPYIFHPFHLAEQMKDEASTCVALLHDVIEDTAVTFEELEHEFPEEIISALRYLTHEKDVPYVDYIQKIKENPIALQVKLADLAHNSDHSRFNGINMPQYRLDYWKQKYSQALDLLTKEKDS